MVDAETWGIVQAAQQNVEGFETFVTSLLERGRHRLTVGEACYGVHDVLAVQTALEALVDAARLDEQTLGILQPIKAAPPCTPRPDPSSNRPTRHPK